MTDTRIVSLAACLAIMGLPFAATAIAAPAELSEPLLPAPTVSSTVIDLQYFATLPKHADGSAARVEFLGPAPDQSTDLIVTDMVGVIYRVSADGTTITPYLDLRNQGLSIISDSGEEGLVGVAIHPNFAGNPALPGYGKFYTAYSAAKGSGTPDFLANDDADHDQVIREWTATNPFAATFSGTSREVLRVGKYASNHNGGVIRFNPNATPGTSDYGNLYIGFGDGGGGNDPRGNGQNLSSPLGKILRINPLAGPNGAKYTIPSDNPFQSVATAGPLVWAYGLRNPQQFSWEIGGRGRMFIDDIGQNQVEEVNLGVRGGNYGWQMREGTFATGAAVGSAGGKNDYGVYPLPANDSTYGFLYPIAEYDHSDQARDGGTVASGIGSGFMYQGSGQAAENDVFYVFADFVQGRLFAIDARPASLEATTVYSLGIRYDGITYQSLSTSPLGEGTRSDVRIGEDSHGGLYALLKGPGAIYRALISN
ncbi:PQQ-dependent sugar dehydrogenase [Lichenicola sp.]|uniref:PQQ-dependent sugar dehydrogenase n=1 Tax=Lichenicola sp. TaxID=2804529 RepID=UPI003AFFA3E9